MTTTLSIIISHASHAIGGDRRSPLDPPRSLRPQFIAGLIIALTVVIVTSGAPAAAGERSDPVIVTLYPGWNMTGWVGADAPVSLLFDQVPALESVATWDAERHRYTWARPGDGQPGELRQLTTGMGLWLRLGGSEEMEWEQQPADGTALIHLRPGRNLVAWTGQDPESVWSLARRLAPAFVRVSRWDAAERRQTGYSDGGPPYSIPLRALRTGDAVWLEVTDDRYWWHSGTALTSCTAHRGARHG